MNPHEKHKNPVFPSSNCPPHSSISMPFPSYSAQLRHGFSTFSPELFPLSMVSPFTDLETFQNLEETGGCGELFRGAKAARLRVSPRDFNTEFRKIDRHKWEFAREGFLRGNRHLLHSIQRRKSHQSQPVGSSSGKSTEAGKIGLESEQDEPCQAESSLEGKIVKYIPDLLDLAASSITPEFDPFAVEQLPEFHLQGVGDNIGLESDNIQFQVGNIAADETVLSPEFLETLELDVRVFSNQGTEDPLFKGKNVVPPEVTPDDSAMEKNFPIFSSPGTECFSLHATGSSDAEKWPGNESSFGKLDDQVRQHKDHSSKKLDPYGWLLTTSV
ncbi:hypothetical protein ACH5RR_005571 [Cinchona calisaya]|uniref:Uncharacterized protein n=1 Tax=Cinchona calisaya TaxID=153742 RepID=A0ABD3ALJ6_9GENT